MKTSPLSLATVALTAVLGSGCSITPYTLDPVTSPEASLTVDQEAITVTRGDVSVTVGPLGHVHGNEMRIGLLVNNNSDEELRVRLHDARVLVNGKTVSLIDQAEIDRLNRMDRTAGALSAATTSLAQSNARMTRDRYEGTPDERRGDVERTALETDMERSLAAQQVFDASLKAMEVRQRLGELYVAELEKANSATWIDTYEVRSMIVQNVQLMDQYLWRDETIPPRSWILRCLFTDPDSVETVLAGQGGRLGVEIDLDGERFAYNFDAVVRSIAEANAEFEKRRARVLSARGK